ncbi:acyl-ACP--UDP-N-acetylglucosamine O-acyltransferase [Thiospirillum jenense]|uniref:Acyl-[acyl-carrier-protein]--UDP-N-acetylglucosamine O-acyltransferase n=1 Tax=Thiospirillum jenense TaxID=1653858 RepID=A0A839HKS1_9GAMM|nr:acyl-ACP--UDP-N-acetylglucosamine O-acyltransferase [Thiospirillum jenense]MBB1126402.1 acyl-ACP--UDP-N-acetylglucosamine O-acyltransferase [Thiospirillum jenense]
MIHSTAIIDRHAQLHDDIDIGPYVVIGAEVQIDRGCRIGPHAVLRGPTIIGQDNQIFQFASIGEDPQDKKYAGEKTSLSIGDRNVIREFATIHRGTVQDQSVTQIGHDNLLMAYTHVAHDCRIGNHTILANAASLGGHIEIHDWAILGGFTVVHQFCRLGAHCFTAMGSVINKDVPPYVIVGGQPTAPHGINTEGLKRRHFSPELIRRIRHAYRLLYRSQLLQHEALAALQQFAPNCPDILTMVEFIQNSQRGILR